MRFKNFRKFLILQKRFAGINLGKGVYRNCINTYSTGYEINLKVNNVSLNKYVEHLQKEYNISKNGNSAETRSRLVSLKPIMNMLNERKNVVDNLCNLKELLQDRDVSMKKLAEEEKGQLEGKIKIIDDQLIEFLLLINEEVMCNSIVLEVNGGVGGQEAMLFARELFNMYCNFAEYKGWDVQIAEDAVTDLGGLRHGSALINGNEAMNYFKYEAGVHRVQRTPATEKAGRVHTSTVSVIVLPQPSNIDIELNSKDLKIETKKASGAGGQHVNTTDSAVRIVHLLTGTAVECQVNRSQIKNKEIAMQRLRAVLYQQQLEAQLAESIATKKTQVRSNFRNEKIRTYNFNQDRVTDHRLQGVNTHNLKVFMAGGEPLDNLISKLHENSRLEALIELVNNLSDK